MDQCIQLEKVDKHTLLINHNWIKRDLIFDMLFARVFFVDMLTYLSCLIKKSDHIRPTNLLSFSSMPAVTFDLIINQVKEIDPKLPSERLWNIRRVSTNSQGPGPAWRASDVQRGVYGHLGIIAGTRSSGGCRSRCFFLAAPSGGSPFAGTHCRFTIPFPFPHKFVLWFGFLTRSYSTDSTRLWTIANRAKQSK